MHLESDHGASGQCVGLSQHCCHNFSMCIHFTHTHMQIKACIKIFSPPIHITHINDLNEDGCVIQLLNFSNKQQGYCVTNVDIPIKASLL